MRRFVGLLLSVLYVTGCVSSSLEEVGLPLPLKAEGELDIHFINTGRGESTYIIYPDGTTFLTDASGSLLEFGVKKSDPLIARPSSDISAGQVIVDYINHFSPEVSKGRIDYVLLTHYHEDHMGTYSDSLPYHESGRFQLSSLPEIGSNLVIGKIMDRDYPDYDYPSVSSLDSKMMRNYRAFLDWTKQMHGTCVERWKVGSEHQVVSLHQSSADVKVRNVCGNGMVWTGVGENDSLCLPAMLSQMEHKMIPSENAFSCGYILSFGDFDFFTAGDLQYNNKTIASYFDMEAPVAAVSHKVEVMKANHHGTAYTNGVDLLGVLRPDVCVFTPWRDVHPRPATVQRFLDANSDCDFYCTNMPSINRSRLEPMLEHFQSESGHVVIRVDASGCSYKVYSLDDTDQAYRITKINGPYLCD